MCMCMCMIYIHVYVYDIYTCVCVWYIYMCICMCIIYVHEYVHHICNSHHITFATRIASHLHCITFALHCKALQMWSIEFIDWFNASHASHSYVFICICDEVSSHFQCFTHSYVFICIYQFQVIFIVIFAEISVFNINLLMHQGLAVRVTIQFSFVSNCIDDWLYYQVQVIEPTAP